MTHLQALRKTEANINNSNMPKAVIVNVMGEWSERFMSSDRGLFISLFLRHSMAPLK